MNKQLQNDFSRYDSNGQFILDEYHCGPGSTCNVNVPNIINGETFAEINLNISPWNFPTPLDTIVDYNESDDRFNPYPYRTMELWSKEQLETIL